MPRHPDRRPPPMPTPDYLVRAALTWARINGKLWALKDAALLDDLRPDPKEPWALWRATAEVNVRASLTADRKLLCVSFRYSDSRVVFEYALPAAFADAKAA